MGESYELLFKVRAEGQAQIDAIVNSIKGVTSGATGAKPALVEFEGSTKKASESMAGAVLKANLLTEALTKGLAIVKEYTVGAAQYAARTETLSVVMDRLAKVNHLSTGAVRAQADEVKRLGITTQESMSTINKMIFAQLDLKKASDLARLSQNAAVIAGVNSSEAMAGIIHGIVTRQPEVLRTYGIIVDFERTYAKVARERGHELSAAEKQQVAMNVVLAQGTKIAGAYEAAMLTAGKQMTSLARYVDEAKNSIGEGLVPALSTAVMWMTRVAKYAEENGETFSKMAVGITAAGAAYAAFRFVPGPLPVKLGAGAIAGGATWLLGTPDPVGVAQEQGQMAISNMMRQRADINRRLAGASGPDAEALRAQFEGNKEGVQTVVKALADSLAQIYISRGKGIAFEDERLAMKAGDLSLGYGVKVGVGDILLAMKQRKDTSGAGATFDQAAYDKAVGEQVSAQAAEKAKSRGDQMRRLIDSLDQKALDPLAGLIESTSNRLREIVAKYGGLAPGEAAAAQASLRGAIGRELGKRTLEPIRSDLAASGFQYGWLPTVANTATVDPTIVQGRIESFTNRTLAAVRAEASLRERIVSLTAGPGGELDAIERIAEMRRATAEREFQITKDRGKLEQDIANANAEREVAIAQYRRRSLEDYRQQAGQVWDAMTASGGGGLRDLALGQGRLLGRQVFSNASAGLFQRAGGFLGRVGAATGLGGLLAGTILDPQNASPEVASRERNTLAIDRLTGAVTGTLFGTGGGTGGGRLGPLFSGSQGGGIFNLLGFGGGAPKASLDSLSRMGLASPADSGAIAGPAATASASRMNWLAGAGAVAAGGFGVYSGLKAGGVQGGLTAGGAAAGTAAALLSLAGFTGPAAPILAAAGLGLGLAASLMGDPKKRYASRQEDMLRDSRFFDPVGVGISADIYGRTVDYDKRGLARSLDSDAYRWDVGSSGYDENYNVVQGRARPLQVVVQVQAMDSKSFMDRRGDIAAAVRTALQDGHALGRTITRQVGAAF